MAVHGMLPREHQRAQSEDNVGTLKVESAGIDDVLSRLKTNAWLTPSFQRDFVWTESDVAALAQSVVEARPIGMATLWAQPDDSELKLEPVWIPDSDANGPQQLPFAPSDDRPNSYFAILDGRQRCTALAMAFGGLRAKNGSRRYSGRYFLDVTSLDDPAGKVVYLRQAQIKSRKLTSDASCIGQGLFPLDSSTGQDMVGQWLGYVVAVKTSANYPGGQLPEAAELERRADTLNLAFRGINSTRLAIYIVPEDYSLGDICEIFETLNTTGTKVSTVDLLHSWLVSDTSGSSATIELRDWIDELGEYPGAEGWASRSRRPELTAQMVTACYVALEQPKPAPRKVGIRGVSQITSIKAGDLLATPTEFWRRITGDTATFASYFEEMQYAVANGAFTALQAPYPASTAIYIAMRWYMDHEPKFKQEWTKKELDTLFRAFFWRNALAGRYDQGFLSQVASDIRAFKFMLTERQNYENANAWSSWASGYLADTLGMPVQARASLVARLSDTKPQGAAGRAFELPLRTRPKFDLLEKELEVGSVSDEDVDLHHIFPKAWCRDNDVTTNGNFDYVNSIANLMTMTRSSNRFWSSKAPSVALAGYSLTWENSGSTARSHFIDRDAFECLQDPSPDPVAFWERRANIIADELLTLSSLDLGI